MYKTEFEALLPCTYVQANLTQGIPVGRRQEGHEFDNFWLDISLPGSIQVWQNDEKFTAVQQHPWSNTLKYPRHASLWEGSFQGLLCRA